MNDLISRQAAIDAIEEYADRLQMVDWKENPGVPYKAYALNWCINTIRDLPSAQPEASILTVTVNPDSEEIERVAREIKDAPVMLLPSAQPERKTGKWINAYPDIEPNPMLMYGICSVCGFEQSISDKLKYCPNCGARMEGEEE